MYSRQRNHGPKILALLLPGIICVAILLALTAHPAEAAGSHVDAMVLKSDIGPASLHFLTQSIATAQRDKAQALVIEIDTPGGDIDSMKAMTQEELASSIPIISYVSPSGGRAASAGAFVALSAQIAAMAPTTRIGASSPVTGTGADIGSTLKAKVENDLIAAMTGIQQRYQRNVPLAVQMIKNASSYDDATAIKEKIVDLGAPDLSSLLSAVNGRTVQIKGGQTVSLQTAGASIQTLSPTPFDELYAFLLDPNIAFLLFIVAMIGIYLEISHPGVIVPGVVGSIALLLFLLAVGSLSPNWAGLALMVLAFVLLVLDLRLPTHGALTIGAVVALVVGTLIFFNSGGPYSGPKVNPLVVYAMGALIGLIGFTLVTFIMRAQRMPVTTGMESMIGSNATALTPLLPEGRVNYAGENWAAILDPPATSVDAGAQVQVTAIEGLRLHVRPLPNQSVIDTHSVTPLK
ncbi:nodulation protein NfeD [Ktedonosporobacter rubrisoli]|uniref:Nodulation protein NfeD n=1 Tax=Ktedonosporobacter rubrisoli TaxID=2509675 RepID=A0A4V0YZ10_KTERU|nr:nodulation protein NfeD [Ktedonosporobacter rubrisoli]QBD78091.1 nodulation protein NfeD [Ktedonosporobacter rubrisoli]